MRLPIYPVSALSPELREMVKERLKGETDKALWNIEKFYLAAPCDASPDMVRLIEREQRRRDEEKNGKPKGH